jgi:hypothetical protein
VRSRLLKLRRSCSVAGVLVAALVLLAVNASASDAASPVWAARSVALPTSFSTAGSQSCLEGNGDCNEYLVTFANVGTAPSTEELTTLTDTLPSDIAVQEVKASEHNAGNEPPEGESPECTNTASSVTCQYLHPVPPGGVISLAIIVTLEPGIANTVTNHAEVDGGGAGPAETAEPTTVPNSVDAASAGFGLQDFGVSVYGNEGGEDTRAGDHPGSVVTTINYNTETTKEFTASFHAIAEPKTTLVDLPLGFVGNPLAAAQCREATLRGAGFVTPCPKNSRVGTVTLDREGQQIVEPLYNVVPDPGYPAEFGFELDGTIVLLRARVLPSRVGYILSIEVPDIPRSTVIRITGVTIMIYGDPAEQDKVADTPKAFFTNPTDCTAPPLGAAIELNSWVKPDAWTSATHAVMYEASPSTAVSGCEGLLFEPKLAVTPKTTQADTPSGYDVALTVPQTTNAFPIKATPDLKDAEVTLPPGVSVSPGAADGLVGCQASGPEGIELGDGNNPSGHVVEEGEELGPDGVPHAAAGHCPAASQVGEVEVKTPILPDPLHGHVFLAQPLCGAAGQPACTEASATDGELFGIYLEAAGSGVVIKLEGTVHVNPQTGQISTSFENAPQFPFSEVKLAFNEGPRAPLSNPQSCGEATTASVLTPWSAPMSGPAATPFSSFAVTGCGSTQPFAPGFLAQTTTPAAGASSVFTLTLSRHDGEQNLSSVGVAMPPGLLGMLSQVQPCPESQASNGTCGPESLIGHTSVAAGSGSHPFWEQGTVFLTAGYEGAPFGLSIVTPTKAGPFNLGNIVVRARINVDPHTAAVTVTSDPLPRIIDGVPLRIQTINVMIDRQGFIFNPTNCAQQRVAGTIAGALPDGSPGASAAVSAPFAVAGCRNLPFEPKLAVSTAGKTSKADGASLHIKLVPPHEGAQSAGSSSGPSGSASTGSSTQTEEANIAKVKVELPKALPSQLKTLQKACTSAQFDSNPAGCPEASIVGMAIARTPILDNPLTGPAYFVSHGNEAFPQLIVVLQGEGITVDLVGDTFISKAGITSSTFGSVPDVPVSSFELTLPQGKYSALAANGNLCAQKLAMPTEFVGQNGAVIHESTSISVEGCSNSISIVSHSVKGRHLTVSVSVPAAGKLIVSGKGLSKASKASKGREILTLKLKTTKGGKFSTKVKLAFMPSKGKKLSKSLVVKFKK